MNGPLHLGHGFTATRVDAYARFKRMQGFNTLFPWAWHWTGQPIVAAAERLSRGDPAMIREFKEIDGVPEEEITKFVDPVYMARYYTEQSREAIKRMGYSIDWRREFHTTSLEPTFSKFVEWQYERLRQRGYVVKGTHPVVWCPRDQSPTGDHDRLEGEGVTWEEHTLMKFKLQEAFLPAATLRPETVFGATNLWINPDGHYVRAQVNGETWIISNTAARKLGEQLRTVTITSEFLGKTLIGQSVEEPIQGASLPILPGWFVDTEVGTGIVYSVPAHAPYDLMALRDLQADPTITREFGLDTHQLQAIQPISIIQVEGFGPYPAVEVVEALGVKDQKDPKCKEATDIVYKKEFHTGILKTNCGAYAGKKVSEVKQTLIQDFRAQKIVDQMYDLPELVVCRCTTTCIVKVLEDQWFLKYSDPAWKRQTIDLVNAARVLPESARQWFIDVINWYKDWPCARRVGLGTPLSWSEGWIVETLSDSTVYMAYYTIRKFITMHQISEKNLTLEVFDYIYLGKGEPGEVAETSRISKQLLVSMRKEFLYWYPIDLRNSAKELLPNHLTFFLFQHVALFEPQHWPRSIGVNGMMMSEGVKMSKSKGNVIPLRNAVDQYGADAVRATLLSSAEGMDDADWRTKNAEDFWNKLSSLTAFLKELRSTAKTRPEKRMDRWLVSTLQRRIAEETSMLDAMKTRSAFQIAFFDLWNDLRWYLKRVGVPRTQVVQRVLSAWIRLLAPFLPFTAEELYRGTGHHAFVSTAAWPTPEKSLLDPEAEVAEWAVSRLIEDVKNILRVITPRKKRLYVYVAEPAKGALFHKMVQARAEGKELISVLREVIAKQKTEAQKKRVAEAFQKMTRLVNELGEDLVGKLARTRLPDEVDIYREAKAFLQAELGLKPTISVSAQKGLYDPQNKSKSAQPLKPAVYIE